MLKAGSPEVQDDRKDRLQPLRYPRRADRARGQHQDPQGRLGSRRRGDEVRRRAGRRPGRASHYARMRHELRSGILSAQTRERISLAVAERRSDPYSWPSTPASARAAGLGLDEVSRARSFRSSDEREAHCSLFLEALLATDGRPSAHLRRGGTRGGLVRRGDPGGGRPRRDERVPEPRLERRGAAAGPDRPLDPPRRGIEKPPSGRLRDGIRKAGVGAGLSPTWRPS